MNHLNVIVLLRSCVEDLYMSEFGYTPYNTHARIIFLKETPSAVKQCNATHWIQNKCKKQYIVFFWVGLSLCDCCDWESFARCSFVVETVNIICRFLQGLSLMCVLLFTLIWCVGDCSFSESSACLHHQACMNTHRDGTFISVMADRCCCLFPKTPKKINKKEMICRSSDLLLL